MATNSTVLPLPEDGFDAPLFFAAARKAMSFDDPKKQRVDEEGTPLYMVDIFTVYGEDALSLTVQVPSDTSPDTFLKPMTPVLLHEPTIAWGKARGGGNWVTLRATGIEARPRKQS